MLGAMVVTASVLPFQHVDDCKMRPDCPSVFILQHLYTLVLKPVNDGSILISGDTRQVGFAGLYLPVDAVLRAQIIGDASEPVIYTSKNTC